MDLFEGLVWYLVFLFSTVCHEAAHALAAYKLGDSTAYQGGQASLNPWPHIEREPMGMVFVPLLSLLGGGWLLGWASTPYNVFWARTYPKRSALMALAGPMANLTLVLLSGLLIRMGLEIGIFRIQEWEHFTFSQVVLSNSSLFNQIAMILSVCFSLNMILCLFNLLPFPPLDGGGLLPLVLSRENALRYMEKIQHQPMVMLLGIFLAWNILPYIFPRVFAFCLYFLYLGA